MRAIDGDRIVKIHNECIDKILAIQGNLEIADNPKLSVELQVYKDMLDEINEMPTIEPRCETCEAFNKTRLLIPQPQRTGRWIQIKESIKVSEYKCSECGRTVCDDRGYDPCVDYPYCHCGARMEGE